MPSIDCWYVDWCRKTVTFLEHFWLLTHSYEISIVSIFERATKSIRIRHLHFHDNFTNPFDTDFSHFEVHLYRNTATANISKNSIYEFLIWYNLFKDTQVHFHSTFVQLLAKKAIKCVHGIIRNIKIYNIIPLNEMGGCLVTTTYCIICWLRIKSIPLLGKSEHIFITPTTRRMNHLPSILM